MKLLISPFFVVAGFFGFSFAFNHNIFETLMFPNTLKSPNKKIPSYINKVRAESIKKAFLHSYNGYRKYAWGHDELRPVSNGTANNFNCWGVTIIDSLDTMIIMNLRKEYQEAREFVKENLDFGMKQGCGSRYASVFETNIRYLGGLLAAYDLTEDELYLNKSILLGNLLLPAFNTPTGIPTGEIDIVAKKGVIGSESSLAAVGTLQLEFRRLSELTGNPIYLHKAQKVLDVIQSKKTSLPGLYPIFIDPYRGRFGKDWISWGAYGDSFYEYLLKQYIMVRETVPQYIDMWKLAVNSTIENLVVSARGFPELQYLAQWKNNKLIFGMEHLACFSGGNFILGARTLNDQSLLDLGLSLTSTCYNTYLGTGTQLGPEQFGWDQPIGYTNFPQNRQFQELGYFVTNSKYPLRPEVVESIFYAYRVTGDTKYQKWGWKIFKRLVKHCKTPTGFSGLRDVMMDKKRKGYDDVDNMVAREVNKSTVGGNRHHKNYESNWDDMQHSYFLAETLKYLYLLFNDHNLISLDEYVFNTEAHPIRIGGGTVRTNRSKTTLNR